MPIHKLPVLVGVVMFAIFASSQSDGEGPIFAESVILPVNPNGRMNASFFIRADGSPIDGWGRFESAGYFEGKNARIKRHGFYGYIGSDGRSVVEASYLNASNFLDGIASVLDASTHKWGCINQDGRLEVKCIYDEIRIGFPHTKRGIYSNSMVPFRIQDKWGYLNTKGEIIIQPQFVDAFCFSQNRAGVRCVTSNAENLLWGFIDENGRLVIPPKFDMVLPFSEGLAAVKYKGVWGFIDTKGVWIINPKWNWAWSFSSGRAAVDDSNGFGYIDFKGNVAVKQTFSAGETFEEGLAAVQIKGTELWGYINIDGKMVIDPRFLQANSFREGVAYVCEKENEGYINRDGRLFWKFKPNLIPKP